MTCELCEDRPAIGTYEIEGETFEVCGACISPAHVDERPEERPEP